MSQFVFVNEQQIVGVQDDGTPEGVSRAKLVSGDLVKIPMDAMDYVSVLTGSGNISGAYNAYNNGDGTGYAVNLQVDPGLGLNEAILTTIIYGTIVGVRFQRSNTLPKFSVVIDGTPYDVPDNIANTYFDNAIQSTVDRECDIVIADNLPDKPHTVRVIVYPQVSATNTLVLYGFLGEKRAGYAEKKRIDQFRKGTLTTTMTNFPLSNNTNTRQRGYKSVIYYNSDTVTRTVSLQWDSSPIGKVALAAGETKTFSFSEAGVQIGPGASASNTNLQHQVDTGSGTVYFTAIQNM